MICEKCGGELRQEENKLVCTKCGTEYNSESSEIQAPSAEYVVPRGFSSKKNIIIIIVAALLMAGIVGIIVAVNVKKPSSQTAPSGIQVAERFLSEQNYEQAVIEFEKILEIEPMNVDAYLGLADAYIGLGDTEKALEMLRKGLEQTNDERLLARVNELSKVEAPAVSSSLSSTTGTTTSEPTEEFIASEVYPRVFRDYECIDGETRLLHEERLDENNIFTTTHYGELYDNDRNVTGWGVTGIQVEKIDENGDFHPISERDYYHGNDYSYRTYNERGDIVREENLNTNSGWEDDKEVLYTDLDVTEYSYNYDQSGKIISATETQSFTHKRDGIVEDSYTNTYPHVYEYQANGNYTVTVNRDGLSTVTEYSSEGYELTSVTTYNGVVTSSSTYKHSFEKDDTKFYRNKYYYHKRVNSDGTYYEDEHTFISTKTGNENHDISKENGVVERDYSRTTVYELNEQGRRIGSKTTIREIEDGVVRETTETTVYEFDEQGRGIDKTTIREIENGVVRETTETTVREFDAQGRSICEKTYDEGGNLISYNTSEW